MKAGYGQRNITPDLSKPVYLAGFGHNRRASAIHDLLSARALAIEWGDVRVVLVAVDLIGLGREVSQRIAVRIPGWSVVVAATHTHHAPDTLGLWGPDEVTRGVDEEYLAQVEQAIVEAAQNALHSVLPAQMCAACAQVSGVAKNARDENIVDDQLTTLRFTDTHTQQTLATLMVFPCHPETLFDQNTVITADYVHFLREAVADHSGAPCIFFAGDLGGMMTPDVSEHSFAEAQIIGEKLAQAGLAALDGCAKTNPAQVEYHRVEYTTHLESPLLEAAIAAKLVTVKMDVPGQIQTEASLLRLGSDWLAFVPGELLPATGLKFKEAMRSAGAETAAVVGLANDELGYIIPDEAYQYPHNPFDPGAHYEETMSTGPNAGSDLARAVGILITR